MIGRALWALFLGAIAVVTAGVQLDRQSRYVPSYAESVPEAFRGFAQRHLTAKAIEAKRSTEALEEARKLVARRPMPAEHLRLLSLAEINADQAEAGLYSIQLSARRGWRDRPAQRTMLELALSAGDEAEAARRYAALFVRRSEEEAELRALAQDLFAPGNDEARAVFAEIVADAERWHRIYLRKAPAVLSSDALIDITRRAVESGARFDCSLVDRAAKRLGQSDASTADAYRKTAGPC